jgi:hypothetical protein
MFKYYLQEFPLQRVKYICRIGAEMPTAWIIVFIEMLIVSQLVNIFTAFYGT